MNSLCSNSEEDSEGGFAVFRDCMFGSSKVRRCDLRSCFTYEGCKNIRNAIDWGKQKMAVLGLRPAFMVITIILGEL